MSETREALERLEAIAEDVGDTWDLSDNDRAAIALGVKALREAERLRWTIRNIRLCAAVGRLFGHQAKPQTPEKMVERKDFRFDQILKYCADAGETGSLLRDEAPHE